MPDAGAELDALAAEYYGVWFRYHPDRALAAGVRPAGGWLPAQDDDGLAALKGWLETLILGLDEIELDALDPDRQLDFALMEGAARVEHAELADYDWRARDPGRFLPLGEIHRLTLCPPESLRASLLALLSAIPERLRQAQAVLRAQRETLAPILVRAAAREADSGRCYLHDLIQAPWLRQRCYGLAELERLVEAARAALAGYRDVLARDLAPGAAGGLGCGIGHLGLRLELLHFMDCDPLDLAGPIDRALAAVESELAGSHAPTAASAPPDPDAAVGAPPAEAGRLALHRQVCEALAAELEASALVGLPQAPLRVSAAPACPGSHRYETAYLADRGADGDCGSGGGTLFLPPLRPPGQAETLAQVRERCLAQGWGGSHLLAWAAPERAGRLARRLADDASLKVAWVLYLQGRLAEGAPDDGDRQRRALHERRQRLLLGRLDLDLHAGRIDADAAAARLGDLGWAGDAAEAAVARIGLAPGEALAGAVGCCLLQAARGLAAATGVSPGERAFNDRLLAQGPIPLPLALRRGFGEPFRQAAWAALLRGPGGPGG